MNRRPALRERSPNGRNDEELIMRIRCMRRMRCRSVSETTS
jgi:hypothetical protein